MFQIYLFLGTNMKITDAKRKILSALQKYPDLSQSEQADQLCMSRTSYWRHIKELEDAGVIMKNCAEVDGEKLGLSIRAICYISINNHSKETRAIFENHIMGMSNVVECYAASGENDYVLTVVAKDIKDYYELMSNTILDNSTIHSSHTSFLMKKIKKTNEIPL